jgi:hypothetical protein
MFKIRVAGDWVGPTILGWPRPSRDVRPYLETGGELKGRPETGGMQGICIG